MAAEIMYGKEALACSQQIDRPEELACCYCDAPARIAFGILENGKADSTYIYELHENQPDRFWVHDRTGFAIYLCTKCAKATCKYDQA